MIDNSNAAGFSDLASSPLSVAQHLRLIAYHLKLRAMNLIGDGQIDLAIEDIKAIRRLARLQMQSATVLERMIANQVFVIAIQAEEALLACPDITLEQLSDYQVFLKQHRSVHDLKNRIGIASRAMMLEQIQNIQMHGTRGLTQFGDMPGPLKDIIATILGTADLTEAMREVNRITDEIVKATRQPTTGECLMAVEQIQNELREMDKQLSNPANVAYRVFKGPKTRGKLLGQVFVLRNASITSQVYKQEVDAIIRDDLMIMAFALQRFHRQRQRYPELLSEIFQPRFMDSHPVDPYNDSEFVYQASEKGFLLYSLGPDQTDNGGRTRQEVPLVQGAGQFDIRVSVGAKPEPDTHSSVESVKRDRRAERKEILRRRSEFEATRK